VGTSEDIGSARADITREAIDAALQADLKDAAQDALQAALDTHRTLKHAIADHERTGATVAQARRNHADACAALLPFQKSARVAA
jgi:hypothetical protein